MTDAAYRKARAESTVASKSFANRRLRIALVSVGLADMLLSGSWGPHGNSGVGVSNPLESRRLQPLNFIRNDP